MATHGTTAKPTTDPVMAHWNWDVIEYRCRATSERAMVVHATTETLVTCRGCRHQVRLPR